MLDYPILDKLQSLHLFGMVIPLEEKPRMLHIDQLRFNDRLELLVDSEITQCDNRRLKTQLQKATLRLNACVEDVEFRYKRGLDKAVFM